MKKYFLAVLCLIFLSACGINGNTALNTAPTNIPINLTSSPKKVESPTQVPANPKDTIIALDTKDGQMVIKLYQDVTPNTVKNFTSKVKSGFYNGLSFHRVIDGFMAQGGDPTGTGTGGGSQKSEINNLPFKRGSLGLARTPVSKEISNDSQFFICFTTEGCQHLTGDYVNFGEVLTGLEVLDKIKTGDKILTITQNTK